LSYKILRSSTFGDLLSDWAKYVEAKRPKVGVNMEMPHITDPIEILKKGWVNLARGADFSKLNVNRLLRDAAKEGWNVEGVRILVGLGACLDGNSTNKNIPPIIFAAENGHVDILKTLISLGSSVQCVTGTKKNTFTLGHYKRTRGLCSGFARS